MDENRQQAYLYLIQELLRCSPGSEQTILNDNRDLLDANLVQMMGQMAEALAQTGDCSTADRLINFAREIAKELGLSSPTSTASPVPNSNAQRDFLLQVLQATKESRGNPQVVYPLLQGNLNLLDDNFAQVLKHLATATFSTIEADKADDIALIIFNFSRLIQQFRLGKQAINVEIAIAGYEVITSVYTREAFPTKWATTQMNLGAAYGDRIKGEKADNHEREIDAYKQALLVYTRKAFPVEWARTHMNLGIAYSERIRGDKADNLERAIDAHKQALSIFTRKDFPSDWARTQNNLGLAYEQRIRGDKAGNLKQAIDAYQEALSVRTRKDFPIEWARTQNNLGIAYYQNRKEKAENLERAIEAYKQALSVFTPNDYPIYWAMTQINLGLAYYQNRKEKAENLERAIEAYKQALLVCTREDLPTEWARAHMNLGLAYCNKIRVEKTDNYEQAIEAHKQALSIFTREDFPQENAIALYDLGSTYQTSNQLQLAHNNFENAIETIELLRDEIISGDDIKQKFAEKWTGLYHRMVTVCLEMNRDTEAIEYVERSKTRNLVELILSRDLHNLFPPNDAYQLEQLRDEIAIGQDKIQNHKADDPTALAQHLMQLRQQRNELQNKSLRIGAGFRFDQFQAILNQNTAIIEWFISDDKILAFIIKPHPLQGQEISVWQSTADEQKALVDWASAYRRNYNQQNDNWRNQLMPQLEELAKILHLDELIQQLPIECQRLILIPHRFLHLFPLHALPISHNGKTVTLLDRFPKGVSYAPSCQLLLQAQQRKRPNFTHLFAIQNPTKDLAYTDLEVQAITNYFNPVNILEKETATLTAINKANLNAIHCAHFSCHGYFNQRNPRKSALILADAPLNSKPANPDTERYLNVREGETHDLDKCLTLDAILSLNLKQCRLVTLSACETGLIDLKNTSDEYIGLPSGFLYAGSPSVVASQWRVNDLSSALLMIKLYENLKEQQKQQGYLNVAIALNQAQLWLRDATKEQLEEWTSKLPLSPTQEEALYDSFCKMDSGSKPFHSPYYWAAFCSIGQ